jgi:hypothetical protein
VVKVLSYCAIFRFVPVEREGRSRGRFNVFIVPQQYVVLMKKILIGPHHEEEGVDIESIEELLNKTADVPVPLKQVSMLSIVTKVPVRAETMRYLTKHRSDNEPKQRAPTFH